MQILFFTRLAIYITAFLIPYIHPGVAVPYDSITRWIAFILIPGEMIIAFYMRPPRLALKWGLLAALGLMAFSVIFISGLEEGAIWVLIAGTLAYAWTFLVFFGQGRFPVFAALETFLLAALYYKILSFARSSEEIALQAGKLTPLLIGLTAALFLIHVLVLYFAAFSRRTPDRASDEQKAAQSKIKSRREIVVFSALALALAIVLAFVVPPDFVSHDPVWKQLEDEPPPQGLQGDLEEGQGGRPKGGGTQNGKPLGNRDEKYPSELQNRGQGQGEQNGEGQGGRPGERQGPGGQGKPDDGEGGGGRPDQGDGQGQSQQGQGRQYKNKLKGVPSDKWDQFQQSGGGKGNQSAVMIIASDSQPVYAAAEYLGKFDPVEGFQYNPDELLNRLRDRRLLETWQDPNPVRHPKRTPVEIYYLSTIPQRVLAFRPFSVEPTILQKKYHPFDLSYTATSAISLSNPKDWADIPEPTPAELSEYKEYLEVNLPAAQKARLKQWVQSHMGENGGYFARLNAILQGYRDYRYKMGFSEDSSVAAIEKFLFQTKEGDCTEFANATALLARIAGIPARVVTGYIASKDLQTPAHRGGIKHLREKIPALQKFPIEDLYLVTTSHHHAWAQVYMPGYGWVDIETTSFAIPPPPEFDPNAMDVIIPMIDEEENAKEPQDFAFPWVFAGKLLGGLAILVIAGLYMFRFGRLAYHAIGARKNNRRGLDHILSLLYIRLAENGQPVRRLSETPIEYGSHSRFTAPFAGTYTMLRFKETMTDEQRKQAFDQLRKEYKDVLVASKKTRPLVLAKADVYIARIPILMHSMFLFCRTTLASLEGLLLRRTLVVLIVTMSVGLSACSEQINWIEYRGEHGQGHTDNALYPPLGLRWKLKLQENAEKAKAFNPPLFIDDVIYFGSTDGNFYALDVNTGYMKWIFKEARGAINSVPFADKDTIYFGSNDTNAYAVDLETGQEKWRFPTGRTVQSLVLRYEDHVIFTSDTGATYFLTPDGKEEFSLPNPVWSHHTFQVYDGVVYWAPRGRQFGAYDIANRQFLWTVDVNVPYAVWYSFPAVDDDMVYFASSFYKGMEVELNYYALDRKSGRTVWQISDEMKPGNRIELNRYSLFLDHVDLLDYMAPAVYKDLVIYTSGDTVVRAFHKDDGDKAWTTTFDYPTSSAPTIAGNRVYIGIRGSSVRTDAGEFGDPPKLVCLSAEDGSVLWEMDVEGAILSAPIISGNKMMFGTDQNYFYVLEEVL